MHLPPPPQEAEPPAKPPAHLSHRPITSRASPAQPRIHFLTEKGTAMTIVEERTAITGGAGTHSEVHVAAALDPVGGLLGTREFPATAAGYAALLCWLGKFGDVALVGVEPFTRMISHARVMAVPPSLPRPAARGLQKNAAAWSASNRAVTCDRTINRYHWARGVRHVGFLRTASPAVRLGALMSRLQPGTPSAPRLFSVRRTKALGHFAWSTGRIQLRVQNGAFA